MQAAAPGFWASIPSAARSKIATGSLKKAAAATT
jgi:hypothetical protein